MRRRLLFILLSLFFVAIGYAAGRSADMIARRAHLRDSLTSVLATTRNASDSISILSDLYDLHHGSNARRALGNMAVDAALRSGDSRRGLDLLRNLANLDMRNDSLLTNYMAKTLQFPKSQDREETITFIKLMRNLHQARFADDATKNRRVHDLIRQLSNNPPTDLYERIVLLHAICAYLANSAHGELLDGYMQRLDTAINQLRPEAYALRNCYYVQAALAFRENGYPEKGIAIDRRLLECIDSLESGHHGQGRTFRHYDPYRYVVYTRMLSNYKLLTLEQVEDCHNKIMQLVERDSSAATTYDSSGRPQIYYAMAHKDYATALPLLKKYIYVPYNEYAKQYLLPEMIEAAEALGDKDALLMASTSYNQQLEQALESRLNEKVKELQLVYDIAYMKAEKAETERAGERRLVVVCSIAAAILAVAMIVALLLWRKARKMANRLGKTNRALESERESLKKTQIELTKARDEARRNHRVKSDFIKNISSEIARPLQMINEYSNLIVDCADSADQPYLKQYSECISFSSEMLTTIVNDVLHLSDIDNNTYTINRSKISPLAIVEMCAQSTKRLLKDGVEIEVVADTDIKEMLIDTDQSRLSQIIMQLLTNAAKFTNEGKITISIKRHNTTGVEISVSDTGIGIPKTEAERVFERFVKLDSHSQGAGIGLPLARHLAQLLGGTLTLDTSYSLGARFVLIL